MGSVTVALAFSRARLSDVYTVLRGRDVDTGILDTKQRDSRFAEAGAGAVTGPGPDELARVPELPERAISFVRRAVSSSMITGPSGPPPALISRPTFAWRGPPCDT